MHSRAPSLLGPWFPESSHLQLLPSLCAPEESGQEPADGFKCSHGPQQRIHSFRRPALGGAASTHKNLNQQLVAIIIFFSGFSFCLIQAASKVDPVECDSLAPPVVFLIWNFKKPNPPSHYQTYTLKKLGFFVVVFVDSIDLKR